METCSECGAPLTVTKHTERHRVGRYKVEDGSLTVPVCPNGHAMMSFDELAESERRAAVVVLCQAADIGGAEFKFARKALGLTQAELGALLEVSVGTISHWENDAEAMSRVSRLALLAVVQDRKALHRLAAHEPAQAKETFRVDAA